MKRGFGSDNHAAIHPKILDALSVANVGHAPAYGTDEWSQQTQKDFQQHFGEQAEAFFVFNGTAANALSVSSVCRSYNSVLCADISHMNVDECAAPEFFSGGKLVLVPSKDGKISVGDLNSFLVRRGDQHHSQIKMLSLTQPTELGTVYSLAELKALISWAKQYQLLVHIDGARLANACVHLNCTFREMTTDLGVDIVSFGGTKNGLMGAEAVLFLNPDLANDFKFIRKQAGQLPSKSRFLAAQLSTYLKNDLWKEIAIHSKNMAVQLERGLKELGLSPSYPVQSNAVFVRFPKEKIKKLREDYFFYVWDENSFECRLMTSWDTTSDDIQGFLNAVKGTL